MANDHFSLSVALVDSTGCLLDWDSGLSLEFAAVANRLVRGGRWRDIVSSARDHEGFDRAGLVPPGAGTTGVAPFAGGVRRDYVYRAADRMIHVTEAPLVGGPWARVARDVTLESKRMPSPADAPAQSVGRSAAQHTILLVDDNDVIRSAVANNLRALNYRVLAADGGAAALDLLRSEEPIDLLFTDVIMPRGIDGVELAREARALRPNIKLLFASGFGVESLQHGGTFALEAQLLTKPYDLPQLLEMLRAMLLS